MCNKPNQNIMKKLMVIFIILCCTLSASGQRDHFIEAFKQNDADSVKKLIEDGYKINNWHDTILIRNEEGERTESIYYRCILADALFYGADTSIIKYLIDQGTNLKKNSIMVLMEAFKREMDITFIKYLVGKGADINSERNGVSLLMRAAYEKVPVKYIDFLIKNNAREKGIIKTEWKYPFNDNIEEHGYYSSLPGIAVGKENFELLKLLYEKYDYPTNSPALYTNKQATEYLSPVKFALVRENVKAIKLLHKNGADLNCVIPFADSLNAGLWIMDNTCSYPDNMRLAYYLYKNGVRVDTQDLNGANAMHYVAKKSYGDELAKLLIEKGININKKNNEGMTPLHIAAINEDYPLLYVLLQNHAKINITNNEGKTAADTASEKGFDQLAQLIEQKKTDELFIKANYRNDRPLIKNKIKNIINNQPGLINTKVGMGYTLLHYAAGYDDLKMCRFLIENGADIWAVKKIDDGKNSSIPYPIDFARTPRIIDLFIESGLNVDSLFTDSSSHYANKKKINNAEYWHILYPDLVQEDKYNKIKKAGNRLFLYLKFDKKAQFIEEIKSGEYDLNKKNKEGMTLLHKAIYYNKPGMVKYLVKNDANLNAKDTAGRSSLLYSLFMRQPGIAKYLIKKGANVNKLGNMGASPLFWAQYWKFDKIIKLLKRKDAIPNEPSTKFHIPDHYYSSSTYIDSNYIAIIDHNNIKIHSKVTGQLIRTIRPSNRYDMRALSLIKNNEEPVIVSMSPGFLDFYNLHNGKRIRQIHAPKREKFTALYYNNENKTLALATRALSLKSHVTEYDINSFKPIIKTTCNYIPSIKKLSKAGSHYYTINKYEKTDLHIYRQFYDAIDKFKSTFVSFEILEFCKFNEETGDTELYFEIPDQNRPEIPILTSNFKISKDRQYLILYSYETLRLYSDNKDGDYLPIIF